MQGEETDNPSRFSPDEYCNSPLASSNGVLSHHSLKQDYLR